MKKTFLLAATLGCLVQAQAQVVKGSNEDKKIKANRMMVQKLLQKQFAAGTAQKPTGTKNRVIAQAMQELGGTVDSTTYKYSGTKGSRYNYDNPDLTYATEFQSTYAPRPILSYMNNPLDLLADSIHIYSDGTLEQIETAAYRTDSKINNSISISGNYYTKTANVYNSQGHIVTSYTLESSNSGATYDTTNKVISTYNAAFTQSVADSVFNKTASGYELTNLAKYYYGSTGRIDSVVVADGALSLLEKVTFKYNSGGKLSQLLTESQGFNSVDSFGYTTGINYTTLWDSKITLDFGSGPMTFGNRNIKYPGASGLPDSAKSFNYDEATNSWEPSTTIVYAYTSFNEPQQLTVKENGDILGHIRFYYETYEDGQTSIKPVTENKDFSVYPNPFRNNVSIDWKGKQQSTVAIRLVNILGQEVYSKSVKLNNGKNTLDLPALNSGNYILMIVDAEGKSWSSKVVKQ